MSAEKMQQYLDGKISHADINKEDIQAFVTSQSQALTAARTPSADATSKDALNVRDVQSEIKASAVQPRALKQRSFAPSGPSRFSGLDRSAVNALRIAVGESPFTDVKFFSINRFIPDASHFSRAAIEMDRLMANTPKFVDAAHAWHPLLSRYYFSLLFYLQVFRALKASGELEEDLDIFLSELFKKFPLDGWPVPGPLVPFLVSISGSSPLMHDHREIVPWLPPLAPFKQSEFYVPHNNLLGRVPLPHILLEQYIRFLDYSNPDATGAALHTDNQCARWPLFLTEVSRRLLPFDTNDAGVLPTTPYASGTLSATSLADDTVKRLMQSPFHESGFHVTTRGIKSIRDNIEEVKSLFPDTLAVPNNPAHRSQGVNNWSTILRLDTTRHVSFMLEVFSVYCRHISASVSLAEIPDVGHTAGQIISELATELDLTVTGRFPPLNLELRGFSRNAQLPPSDMSDALIANINLKKLSPDSLTRDQGIQPNHTGLVQTRVGGPFFYSLPVIKRTPLLTPSEGFGTLIALHYHSQTPLRSAAPE
jgi:hypothetical protein